MRKYQAIPVSVAQQVAEQFDKDWVVILGYDADHNLTHTTTYGRSPTNKIEAARYGTIAAEAIGCDTSKGSYNEDFRRDFDAGKLAALTEACRDGLATLLLGNANTDAATDAAIAKMKRALGYVKEAA